MITPPRGSLPCPAGQPRQTPRLNAPSTSTPPAASSPPRRCPRARLAPMSRSPAQVRRRPKSHEASCHICECMATLAAPTQKKAECRLTLLAPTPTATGPYPRRPYNKPRLAEQPQPMADGTIRTCHSSRNPNLPQQFASNIPRRRLARPFSLRPKHFASNANY